MTQQNTARYVQVNIGQGGLHYGGFLSFEHEVQEAIVESVRNLTDEVVEVHEGFGTWGDTQEESVHLSIIADVDTYALRLKLADLATKYKQDAIALIVGSDLIKGVKQ